jgi:Big-like domain-containing protein
MPFTHPRPCGRTVNRGTLVTPTIVLALVVVAFIGLALPAPAHAAADIGLERVGPTDPANGFPKWYQDKTGLTLEFCSPQNGSELDGGWCVLFTGDTTAPESFPGSFADEHFYYVADAGDRRVPNPNGGTLLAFLRIGLEGAFANGPVVNGDQMVFARIRIKLSPVPFDGTYTVYTPAGTFVFPDQLASDPRGIFFTQDVGLTAGVFTDALKGSVGPFLIPSATPGGPEMAPLTASNPTPDTDPAHFGGAFTPTPYPGTGKAYLGDPNRVGPVTGSTLPDFTVNDPANPARNPNVFRIEGPNGFVYETFDFNVAGRVFTDTIPGRVTVDRASYSRNASGVKLDVFATGFETISGRLPAQPKPSAVTPVLTFFNAPCGGTVDPVTGTVSPPFTAPTVATTETQMINSGSAFWGQATPATVPAEVCVKDGAARDATGAVIAGGAYFPRVVTDEVTISGANFDPSARTLTVRASSSDQSAPPTLTLAVAGATDQPSPATFNVSGVAAPPAKVKVLSSAGGSADAQVATGLGPTTGTPSGGGGATPSAVNDTASTNEDTPVTINVLANDTNASGGTVSLVTQPALGTAAINADGSIRYTPNPNRNGNDAFSYKVTVGTTVSNTANVVVTIAPVNDPPVANPDSLTAIANVATSLNVLANDTDPDGDVLSVTNVSGVTPAAGTTGTATATAGGSAVTFTATAAGSYTFSYQAKDPGGLTSGPATVTVTVSAQETLTIARAQFTAGNGGRYRVDGTIAPATGQTMKIELLNAAGTVLRTDSATSDAGGAWAIDLRPFTLPGGANRVRVTSSNGSVATSALTIK